MIPSALQERLQSQLDARTQKGLLRTLSLWEADPTWINLADNDYLNLSNNPAVIAAAREAAARYGCSSSASPLVSGYQIPHQALETKIAQWHGFAFGLVWNSGYAANHALLSHLPRPDDIVFADRLIHHSMISGILQSGARLIRYRHNDIDHLRTLLAQNQDTSSAHFVVTESVFSMDGDAPDLQALAELKEQFSFCLILDEAHATGWYGPNGTGLAAEAGVIGSIDILVGTLGKTLGSQGAYTLFHDAIPREFLINHAGEFIYSTYLSPIAAAAALAAIEQVHQLSGEQTAWRKTSRNFREGLRSHGWNAPDGDSPIVPVIIGNDADTLGLADFLRQHKVLAGAIRPPTVPPGGSRLRLSLKRNFTVANAQHVTELLNAWRATQI